ncbi:tetratricopeptide repeat protein [Zeaxanthinibacter enoshimensis]|uniref:Tetratricopeptide repeat protein n=1 Tax=Zeaxanthinibacter enoshimensis TaxID=392009 RepID=A0A4R6TIP9_9FLAO|nr:tetratricopeptide repeat protein [Zeaxanthinibacter enoshimensis]TDQ29096.1 tetratricopeptide repeat protein [Zeaxanthinibacter enoshimensis]
MRTTKSVLFLGILAISASGIAQESKIYTHDNRQYQEALALYNNGQYQAAQTIFEKVQQQTKDGETEANSAYYAANAAVRLNQTGADRMMEDFVTNYPTSTKQNAAYRDVADYYFRNGKYPNALRWYSKVDQGSMSPREEEEFNFNMGYSLFATGKPGEGEKYLNKVVNSDKYGSQAKYYLGYIAYQQDDYEKANARFNQIEDQEVLDEKLSYYQADMNFKQGKFEEAIALAKKQIPRSEPQEVSELNKIIGESYFNLGQYQNAIPYLEAYKGKRGKWSNTDYYLLGYSYYKQGDFANAIQQFNKIIGGTNSVSQNAYYHLADSYLKLGKKQEALNAFRNASQMEFSAEIAKDAYLNYARLSYELGNAYEPVPQVLTTFLQKYPGDPNTREIQALLVDSYITSRNFKGALDLLEKNRDYASKETYQKVAFYRGLELFQDSQYGEALEHFSKSLQYPENALFQARARYWKAESAYLLNRYEEALADYNTFRQLPRAASTTEYKDLDYHQGYALFKMKQYDRASTYFERYANNRGSGPMVNDANVRLGDSYFVSSKYWPAMEAYNKVLATDSKEKDYAAFQKALSYGFVDRNDQKMEELNAFISRYPDSPLKDDALFELGNSYVRAGSDQQALQAYDRLVREYRMSSLVPQALLRQGLIHYNANRNDQALEKFKSVVRDYANSQEAIQAVATAKLIYVDTGRVNEYAQWVEGLDFVEVTDAELDNATYESASKQQLEGRNDAAIRGYEEYLRSFPNGLHSQEAHFNLAQLYFGAGNTEKALPHYKQVADGGRGEYNEQALTRVASIYVAKNDYTSALPYLERLEKTAEIGQNRTFARSNLMKGYYEQGDYQKTIAYAEQVLATPGIDNRIRSDAQVMIARSAIATGNENRAESAYAEVLKIASGELAAEATFYDAYFKNKNGKHEASNTAVQKLVKDFAAYKRWSGKGLVLMARNYYALGDAYQATYILESVIANFSQFPEIVREAKTELAAIKQKESESNSSIDNGGN